MKKAIIIGALAVVALAIIVFAFPRETAETKKIVITKELTTNVVKWYQNLIKGDFPRTVELATSVTGKVVAADLVPQYIGLCKKNGINPIFLATDFNQFDFQYWQRATYFKGLANKIVTENPKDAPLVALFNAVHKQIAAVGASKDEILWPYKIWELKKGLCDRQAWVLCKLAYQLGYETQIVYLMNPKTGVSPHTICEIRKGKQKWVADPFSGQLLENKSITDIMNDEVLLEKTWPGKKEWHVAIKSAIYFLPAYPQDYAPRNQELAKRIKLVLKDKAPRFGENPATRLFNYLHLTSKNERKRSYKLWFYPFRLLRKQMMKATPKVKK